MKHMTCVNHKQASEVCINPECEAKCAYLCLQSDDSCRGQHQACALASLAYLSRKSHKIVTKAHDFQVQKLINLHNNAKKIIESVDNFLQVYHLLSSIKDILDPHGLLEPKQKETILAFLGSKLKNEKEVSLPTLERDLVELQMDIGNYVQLIQEERRKHVQKEDKKEVHRRSSVKAKMQNPTPVKSGLKQTSQLPGPNSKIKEKKEKDFPSGIKQAESVVRVQVSAIRKHVPKPPFFSKITNDIQTINTMFYHKFSDVKLLYRASENEFSAVKFHEKCDGITNTITIVLTEGEKVIGGFTSLPWKSGGGQWYPDPTETTFLFSLTSGQRYPLVNKDKAIWCSRAFGPSFGYPDLQISDKAFYNSNSCANFPQCFNNGNYTASTGSTQMFCGTKNGHFKIKQWEVYELIF